jgi:hypothetical protein
MMISFARVALTLRRMSRGEWWWMQQAPFSSAQSRRCAASMFVRGRGVNEDHLHELHIYWMQRHVADAPTLHGVNHLTDR